MGDFLGSGERSAGRRPWNRQAAAPRRKERPETKTDALHGGCHCRVRRGFATVRIGFRRAISCPVFVAGVHVRKTRGGCGTGGGEQEGRAAKTDTSGFSRHGELELISTVVFMFYYVDNPENIPAMHILSVQQ